MTDEAKKRGTSEAAYVEPVRAASEATEVERAARRVVDAWDGADSEELDASVAELQAAVRRPNSAQDDAEQDSPPFVSTAGGELTARDFERVNRWKEARLDEDGTAKPLTEIREVFDAGDGRERTLFHGAGESYVVRSTSARYRCPRCGGPTSPTEGALCVPCVMEERTTSATSGVRPEQWARAEARATKDGKVWGNLSAWAQERYFDDATVDRPTDGNTWSCAHGYEMPSLAALCPHCIKAAWERPSDATPVQVLERMAKGLRFRANSVLDDSDRADGESACDEVERLEAEADIVDTCANAIRGCRPDYDPSEVVRCAREWRDAFLRIDGTTRAVEFNQYWVRLDSALGTIGMPLCGAGQKRSDGHG